MAVTGPLLLLAATLALPPGGRGVRIRVDGGVVSLLAPERGVAGDSVTDAAPARGPGNGEIVWWWSTACAAQRLTPKASPGCIPTVHRTVVVRDPQGKRAARQRVLWGGSRLLSEVPDGLLPETTTDAEGRASLQVDSHERAFVRIAGPRLASGWIPLPPDGADVPVCARPAFAADISVADGTGAAPRSTRLELVPRNVAPASAPIFRTFADAGVLRVPPLPRDLVVDYLLSSPDSVPVTGTAKASDLPRQVVLRPGVALRGRFVTDGDPPLPVPGVRVDATFLLPGGEHAFVRSAESSVDGRVSVVGVAQGPVDVLIRSAGHASRRTQIEATAASMDFGTVVLGNGISLAVRALDESGTPVSFPEMRIARGPWIAGDEGGIVRIDAVAAGPQKLEARAPRFLPVEASVEARAGLPPVDLRMVRGAAVTGWLRRADNGEPAGAGRVALDWEDGATWTADIDSTGRIDLSGLRSGTLTLEFRAAGLSPLRLSPSPLARGETIDLGEVRLSPGAVIAGTVLADSSGLPIAGARIRVPRPTPQGPRLSVLRRDWVEAESDSGGRFILDGLGTGVVAVLVEAPGFAPHLRSGVALREDGAGGETDLGEVRLGEPKDLSVACRPERRCGREVRLLLGGPENDWAFVSAPLVAGRAQLSGIPPGARPLRLIDRGAVILERTAEVASDVPASDVSISLPSARVDGEVTRGGRHVGGGDVLFRSSGRPDSQPAIYFERRTETTLPATSEVIGVVPRVVSAEVDLLGRFLVPDMLPGSYDLVYLSPEGASSRPRNVVVPESGQVDVRIELPAATLTGTIELEDGSHPMWASIEISPVQGEASHAYAGPDGSFRATGLDTGLVRVRASDSDFEGTIRLDLREGANEGRVVMKPKPSPRLEVRLLGADGRALGNTVAFLRCGEAIRPATSDSEGVVHYRMEDPGTVQVASFHPAFGWAFSATIAMSRDETRSLTLSWPREPATLEIESAASPVRLLSPEGFPAHLLFGLAGVRTDANLTVSGLPPGCYAVFAGAAARTACLAAGKRQTVRF